MAHTSSNHAMNGTHADSDIDSEYPSGHSDYEAFSNRTVSSTAHDFRYENGRRYHAYRGDSYPFPNDDLNTEHEILLHHLFILLFRNDIYLAPIINPKHVIDLGTGTGLWAIDFANHHEDAEVLGVDLNPNPVPMQPNLEFLVDDITQEWTYGSDFDFIHIRSLFGSIADWATFHQQCFDNMRSGGYIEQAEIQIQPMSDNPIPMDSIFRTWRALAEAFNNKTGRSFFISDEMKAHMAHAGFVDIVENRYKLPLGTFSSDPRAREVGKFFERYFRTGMQGWIMRLATQILGCTVEDVEALCRATTKALDEGKQHIYYYAVVIYARKP